MRKVSIVAVFLMTIISTWSCKSFEGAVVNATPDPIEVHADSIKYTVRASVPPKANMKKGGIYSGEGFIGSRAQRKLVISSDKYPDLKKTGLDTTLKVYKVFYDDMNGNALKVKQSYERRGKEFELPDLENLAKCCITTSRLIWENYQYVLSQHEYKREVPINLEARFNFPKNVFNIQKNEYDKGDITAIGDFMTKKLPATKITIEGFASPEGPYERNVMLSVNRSKQVQKWLMEKLEEAGYESYLDSSFFDISVTHEDWDGFKASINGLPYSQDIKSQILEVISAGLDEDERESQIMALVGGKDKVEDILAPLRRATIRVQGYEPRRTDEEIDQIASDFIAGSFSGNLKETYGKEEWLYAVSRQEEWSNKKPLLQAFREVYPADYRAFNDLGAIFLMEGDTKAGREMLEGAEKLKAGDYAVANNLGVGYVNDKRYKDAKKQFETSMSAQNTPEANFNLGVVLEKMARYNQGVEKFNSAEHITGSSYNAGLCKVLLNDLAGAKASLKEAIKQNPDNAMPYYVLAIAGAKATDASTMTVNLKKACSLDGKLKSKAKKDLEFRKYWNSPEFKAATK